MKKLAIRTAVGWATLFVVVCACLGYTYTITENLYTPNWSNWTVNGTLTPIWFNSGNYGGLGQGSAGSMLSTTCMSNGGEVSTTLRVDPSNPTVFFMLYLDAASDTYTESDYSWTVSVFNYTGAPIVALDRTSPTQVTRLVTDYVSAFQDGMIVRAISRPDAVSGTDIIVYINNSLILWYNDSYNPSECRFGLQPTLGFENGGTLLSELNLGPLSTVSPNQIPATSISTSASWNQVSLSWPAGTESSSGTGVYGYQIYRNGELLTTTTGLSYVDSAGITPSKTYSYTLSVIDYHWNITSTNFSVATPNVPTKGPFPSVIPDGRSVGSRPTGTYWGAGNENINVMSGNLTFILPLFKAMGRSNSGVQFNLVYNSQNWRQDSGGPWNLSGDVGYGYGWQLLAGSITPVWNPGGFTASYYLYTDSTGAQYDLNQNNNNVWSSSESTYVYFDANAYVLHFRDGSFWAFDCISAGTEADSGVMHPTLIEDSNGNQILIRYQTAPGASWPNSSARITQIEDVRAVNQGGSIYATYAFTYNSDTIPHLTSISNYIQTGEAYTFTYVENQALSSPINSESFGTTTWLGSTTVTNLNATNDFTYDGSGELTKVVMPYGGYLAYSYGTTTYSSSGISYREVTNRYLSPDGTQASQLTYPLTHEPSPVGPTHQYSLIVDPSGTGQKYWTFSTGGPSLSLVTQYQGQQLPGPVTKTQNTFTWAQDANGNNYIGSTTTTLDPGLSYSATSATSQTVDIYGNVTQVQKYNYGAPGSGNAGSLARTYTYTYLNSSAYLSAYIFNRLTGASVTNGSTNVGLATNYYDNSSPGNEYCPGSGLSFPQNYSAREWDSSYATNYTRGDVTCAITPGVTAGSTIDDAGNISTATVNNVTTQVSTSSSNNFAAPTQLTVGSLTTNLSWSSFLGLTNETGPNGASTSIYYDQYARQTGTTSPFGATTGYSYSNFTIPPSTGQTVTTTTTDNQTTEPPYSGRWSKNTLDGLGRTILTQTGDVNNNVYSQAESVYGPCACSPNGKLMKQAMPHTVGGTVAYTVYTYDGIGRTISVLSPDGASTTTYSYQGNAVTVTDPAGHWKTFTMDSLGHLVQVTEPNPGSNE